MYYKFILYGVLYARHTKMSIAQVGNNITVCLLYYCSEIAISFITSYIIFVLNRWEVDTMRMIVPCISF